MQLSIDDLIRINAAVIDLENHDDQPPHLDQITLSHVARILEHSVASALDDPIATAAYLAAYVSWARPFGPTSDRAALVTAAVAIDLSDVEMPRDWTGFANLLVELRALGISQQGRSAALKSWLESSAAGAQHSRSFD